MTLEDSLLLMAEETSDTRLAEAARQLAADLSSGVALDRAVGNRTGTLPRNLRSMLEAGIQSGDPAALLADYSAGQLKSRDVGQTILTTFAYPLMIFVMLVLLAMLFGLIVVPEFAEIFYEFGLMLPPMTELTIAVANDLPWLLVGLAIAAPIAFVLIKLLGRPFWHRVRATLPLMGKLWQWAGQQELAGTLAILVRQRLPMHEAFAYAADMVADQNVARACRTVSQQTEKGVRMSDALGDSIHFDRLFTSLVRWGEDHDLTEDALTEADRFFGQRFEHQAAYVRRIVPPITLIVVVVAVGMTVVSLFIPLVRLIEGLA